MQHDNDRLRIATRIHFALLRQYGADVQVDALLRNEGQAREALWVCEASEDAELRSLARQLRRSERVAAATAKVAVREHPPAPQDAAWARNTSGFGVTSAVGLDAGDTERSGAKGWLNPSSWLKRAGPSDSRH